MAIACGSTTSPISWPASIAVKTTRSLRHPRRPTFPLLSDADKSVATRYGVLAARGLANRWTFYIDRNGRIAYIDRAVNPETSAEDIIAAPRPVEVVMTLRDLYPPNRGFTIGLKIDPNE